MVILGVRGRVARTDVRRQHGAHAAQQKSCRRQRSTHLAGAEGAENRVQDEQVESSVFAPVLCAWCGGRHWEVVRVQTSHVGRRYGLCSAWVATVARGVRGERRGSPGSRAHLLALGRRTLQVPKRRRALALDVISTSCQHFELLPVSHPAHDDEPPGHLERRFSTAEPSSGCSQGSETPSAAVSSLGSMREFCRSCWPRLGSESARGQRCAGQIRARSGRR